MAAAQQINLYNYKIQENNMRYLFCCEIPVAIKCWFIGSIFEVIGLVWVILYFFLSMGNPDIAVYSLDFNVNAISLYNQ